MKPLWVSFATFATIDFIDYKKNRKKENNAFSLFFMYLYILIVANVAIVALEDAVGNNPVESCLKSFGNLDITNIGRPPCEDLPIFVVRTLVISSVRIEPSDHRRHPRNP